MSFGDGNKGYILCIGKIGRSVEHSIDDVHYVNGLKYNFLNVSQNGDKVNEVTFLCYKCIVTHLTSCEVILIGKSLKSMCS